MKVKVLSVLFAVILFAVVFSGCLDNSNLTNRAPPMITFKQNLISGRLIVTSVNSEDIGWWDFDVWVDGELRNYNHDYVKENDSVYAGVRAKLVNIIWKTTNTSIGTWSFADKYNYSTFEVVNYTVTTSWFNEKQYVYMPGFYHEYPKNASDIQYIINTTVKNSGDVTVDLTFFTYNFYNASNEYIYSEGDSGVYSYSGFWEPSEIKEISNSIFKWTLDTEPFDNAEKVEIEIEGMYIDYYG